MKHVIRNDKGEIISGKMVLRKKGYGTGKISNNGQPEVDWKLLDECKNADNDGFDTEHVEPNGRHRMKVELPRGTVVIRYVGNGTFTAPKGTKFEQLSLPYFKDTMEYNEYRVIADYLDVVCIVDRGVVAPGFDSCGGAVQYKHPMSMKESMRNKILERIEFDEKDN